MVKNSNSASASDVLCSHDPFVRRRFSTRSKASTAPNANSAAAFTSAILGCNCRKYCQARSSDFWGSDSSLMRTRIPKIGPPLKSVKSVQSVVKNSGSSGATLRDQLQSQPPFIYSKSSRSNRRLRRQAQNMLGPCRGKRPPWGASGTRHQSWGAPLRARRATRSVCKFSAAE